MLIHERLLNLVKSHFPNTPIYPTLGNHEAHPANTYPLLNYVTIIFKLRVTIVTRLNVKNTNRFAPPEITIEELSTEWLYRDAERLWIKFGLPSEVSVTIRHGGYYTTLARPGLRIVSMNTNYCYTFNTWTLSAVKDPASGLLWLSKVRQTPSKYNLMI